MTVYWLTFGTFDYFYLFIFILYSFFYNCLDTKSDTWGLLSGTIHSYT